MNEAKDEVLDVKMLAKEYNKKEKVISNMIIIAKRFNYNDEKKVKIIKDFYLYKTGTIG